MRPLIPIEASQVPRCRPLARRQGAVHRGRLFSAARECALADKGTAGTCSKSSHYNASRWACGFVEPMAMTCTFRCVREVKATLVPHSLQRLALMIPSLMLESLASKVQCSLMYCAQLCFSLSFACVACVVSVQCMSSHAAAHEFGLFVT